mgnify:FL=1
MESDDRVVGVVKQLDDALAELDKMDLMIGLYKTQLNVRRARSRPRRLVPSLGGRR